MTGLSPEVGPLLEALWRHADSPHTPVRQLRQQLDEATAKMAIVPEVQTQPTRAGDRDAEWVLVARASRDRRVALYFHGGGYALGSLTSARPLAGNLCVALRRPILSLDYRLSPEHPFPAAIEDGIAAYEWLLESGYSPRDMVLAGDSAGGGLSVAVLLALRDRGVAGPAAAMCFSPWLDLTLESDSLEKHAIQDPIIQPWKLAEMAGWYLGGRPATDPLASPVFADLRGLPPLLVQVSSSECLLDDARTFAAVADRAGVDATLQTWAGMPHVWHSFAPRLPEAQAALAAAARWLHTQTRTHTEVK